MLYLYTVLSARVCRQASVTAVCLEHTFRRGGIALQLVEWTTRTWLQLAAAIGAALAEPFGALRAIGALEGADAGIGGVGRQVTVTAFAVGA